MPLLSVFLELNCSCVGASVGVRALPASVHQATFRSVAIVVPVTHLVLFAEWRQLNAPQGGIEEARTGADELQAGWERQH